MQNDHGEEGHSTRAELNLAEAFQAHYEQFSHFYLETFQNDQTNVLETKNTEEVKSEPKVRSLVAWGPRPQMMNLETRLFQDIKGSPYFRREL